MDGDGDSDLLGAAELDDTIAWWENNGDGSAWVKHTVDASAGSPRCARPADIDGDGDLDVIGAAYTLDEFIWWENADGTGTIWTRRAVGTGGGAFYVASEDLDGDGDLDIAAVSFDGNKIAWHENVNGDGSSWVETVIGTGFTDARWVECADIDMDGDSDVIATARAGQEVAVWLNDTGLGDTWTKEAALAGGVNPHSVRVADMDHDGDLDLVVTAKVSSRIIWLENDRSGESPWTQHVVQSPLFDANCAEPCDIDMDGDMDIVATGGGGDRVAWAENADGQGVNWILRDIQTGFDGPRKGAVADIDGDGDLDVIAVAGNDDAVAWWENRTIHRSAQFTTDGSGPTQIVDGAFDGAFTIVAFDMDGDGDLDLLGAADLINDVSWWENNGDGSGWTKHSIDTAFPTAWCARPADIDGDGDIDVVGASNSGGGFAWWENTNTVGTAWARHSINTLAGASHVAPADIDGDGDVDVAAGSFSESKVVWYRNVNGDGSSWAEMTISSSFTNTRLVNCADTDMDGDIDVLGAARGAGEISVWVNDDGRGGLWTKKAVITGFDYAQSVLSSDMDGDGDPDLLVTASNADKILWLENDQSGTTPWVQHETVVSLDGANYAEPCDFDQDGDMDVVATGGHADNVLWCENADGLGTAWITRIVETGFDGARQTKPADFDGDGDLDIVAVAANDGLVAWWRNRGGQFGLSGAATPTNTVREGDPIHLLSTTITHNGRAGDTALELASLGLLLEETPGDPLNTAEAAGTFQNFLIYTDDGDGLFDAGLDTLAATVAPSTVDASGETTLTLPDGAAPLQVNATASGLFHIVAFIQPNALTNGVSQFRVTCLASSATSSEDRDYDIPLSMAYSTDTTGTLVQIQRLPTILYVDIDQPGGDGASWAQAFTNPQTALSSAIEGDEIWVAEGTYTSGADLTTGVALYGGFEGNETLRLQQDSDAHPTMLIAPVGLENAVTMDAVSLATADGLTIEGRNGLAGSGVFIRDASDCLVSNCKLVNCYASGDPAAAGGGLYCNGSTVTIAGCEITNCQASSTGYQAFGGGATLTDSLVSIQDCVISGNSVTNGSLGNGTGGGLHLARTDAVIVNTLFHNNQAAEGAAVFLAECEDITFVNCVFDGNEANAGNAAIRCIETTATLRNTIFSNNDYLAIREKGAIGDAYIGHCLFYGNGLGDFLDFESGATITGAAVLNSLPDVSGCVDGDPLFVDADNGDFMIEFGSAALDTGTSVGATSHDIEGTTRPIDFPGVGFDGPGDGYDIGAYEASILQLVELTGETGPIDFGVLSVNAGADAAHTFTLTNIGDVAASFTGAGVEIVGANAGDFVLDPITTTTLARGESRDFVVRFDPTLMGDRAASVSISMDVSITPTTGIALSGFGVGPILYVDTDAAPGGDSTSWATALTTVGQALLWAAPDDQVWVAEGTYNESITMVGGVGVYGGFSGIEALLSERDAATSETIIDASGAGRVATFLDITSATLDGFTLRNGRRTDLDEDGNGGGVYFWRTRDSSTVSNCVIGSNTATYGGGVYYYQSSATIANCLLTSNAATDQGGGVYMREDCLPSISDCEISGNSAAANGGGLYLYWRCDPTFERCLIDDNAALGAGGAISAYGFCDPAIVNTVIAGNRAGLGGAGAFALRSSPTITNNTVHANTATTNTGGFYLDTASNPSFINTIFTNNSPLAITEGRSDCDPTLDRCLFDNNVGGAYYDNDTGQTLANAEEVNLYADATDCVAGDPLYADAATGDFHLQDTSPALDRATTASAPLDDFEHDARPGGDSLADIGADEVTTGTWTPPVDNTAPVSFVANMPAMLAVLSIDVPYHASDTGSGMDYVELYYRVNRAGPWIQWGGQFAASPIPFTAAADGYYEFYTIATDKAGNVEAAPGTADEGVFIISLYGGARIHVDHAATGGETGLDWPNAFKTLDVALLIAGAQPTVQEIWVAQGTYNESVELVDNVGVYGGFASTETLLVERDFEGNETILDPGASVRHVVTIDRVTASVIDGFTVSGGYADGLGADGRGAGVFCYNADETNTIDNLIIEDGYAVEGGGGMYFHYSSPAVSNITIRDCASDDYGGGVYCHWFSDPTIDNLTVYESTALGGQGGGIAITSWSDPSFTRASVVSCEADFGGGVFIDWSSPSFASSQIFGNYAMRGGAVYAYQNCDPILTNNTIGDNDASDFGGGVFIYGECEPVLHNNIFVRNMRHAIHEHDFLSSSTIRHNVFFDNTDGDVYADGIVFTGAAALDATLVRAENNISADPLFNTPAAGSVQSTPSYNPAKDWTRIFDNSGAPFASRDVVGLFVNPNTAQSRLGVIVAQDANNIYVQGDISAWTHNGATYQIIDYHLLNGSPCIDTGDNDAPAMPALDIDGGIRVDNQLVDIGADESGYYDPVIFVDHTAPPGGDGSDWANAYRTIQAGLDAAFTNAIPEVWVAKGTYTEIITMRSDVAFYGGFNGTETRPWERDVASNETIIDAAGAGRTVSLSTGLKNSRIDGFSITGGLVPFVDGNGVSQRHGGGVYCDGMDDSNTIINCNIWGNIVTGIGNFGGGVYCTNSSPRVVDCILEYNYSRRGSGIYMKSGSAPIVENCLIRFNKAGGPATQSGGGGIYCENSTPLVVNCVITSNSIQWDGADRGTTNLQGSGGGVRCMTGGNGTFINCTITDNKNLPPDLGGNVRGSGFMYSGSTPTIINCLFEGNGDYGLYHNDDGNRATVTNCLFYNNSPADYHDERAGASGTDYTGAVALNGANGLTNIYDGNPMFVDRTAQDFRLRYGSAAVDLGAAGANTPSFDFDGEPRPVDIEFLGADGTGTEYDIGAFELQTLPGIQVSPTFVYFGPWDIDGGPTAATDITITNNDYTTLNFTGVGMEIIGSAPGEFAFTAPPVITPLAAGASRVVSVAFDPTIVDFSAAAIAIYSDDPDEPVVLVSLFGEGIDPPGPVSIVSLDSDPTRSDVVRYAVTFSDEVSGVGADDFVLTTVGDLTGARITHITPGPAAVFTVTVDTGSGDGGLRLDLVDNDSTRDRLGIPLGGPGHGNGDFNTGDIYGVDKTAPNSSVNAGALGAFQPQWTFDVPINTDDGTGAWASGISAIHLFYRTSAMAGFEEYIGDGPWAPGETIVFDASATGPGLYQLYTLTTDAAGNTEAPPTRPDATTAVKQHPSAAMWLVH